MNEILCIYKTHDLTEADLIKAQFEANGINCFLRTDNGGGALAYLTVTNGVSIMIHKDDETSALDILNNRA